MEKDTKRIWNDNIGVMNDIKILIKDCLDEGMIDVAKKYCDILIELKSISGSIVSKRYNR